MNIDITARNFTPSPDLKELIHGKLNGLLRYDSNISSSKVVLLKEGRAEKVELVLKSKHINVLTVDIDEKKSPDVVSDATKFTPDKSYDHFCAFEVFEHINFDEMNIILKKMDRLMTKM